MFEIIIKKNKENNKQSEQDNRRSIFLPVFYYNWNSLLEISILIKVRIYIECSINQEFSFLISIAAVSVTKYSVKIENHFDIASFRHHYISLID